MTRIEFKDYCLRQLGSPVIQINVTDDQIDDCINDSVQYMQEYTLDGSYKTFSKQEITITEMTQEYIDVPDSTLAILSIFPLSSSMLSSSMFNVQYQFALNNIHDLKGNVNYYAQTMQYINTIEETFNQIERLRYSRVMNKLYIDVDWGSDIKLGDYIIIESFSAIDPTQYNKIYDDIFLKRYCTAKIKRQWGQNLSKFEGIQMPGGVMFNGRQILDEATQELRDLEETVQDKYNYPPMFFTG